MSNVQSKVSRLMIAIDEAGALPMSKEDWRDLLEDVIDECQTRLEAVRAELVHDEG